MINALSSGLAGLRAMQSSVASHAARIAETTLPTQAGSGGPSAVVSLSGNPAGGGVDELAANLIGMKESVLLYKANANTVETANEPLGTLLSILG